MSKPSTAALKTSAFKIPGEGSSAFITTVTIAAFFALWFVSTNMGWIKPIFLPSPQATFQQFYEYLTGTANDKPLWQHFLASLLRVFSAFLLACLTAIPVGIAMGMSRFWRGIFDPPIELLRPLPSFLIRATPASTLVNSARNDGPELLDSGQLDLEAA